MNNSAATPSDTWKVSGDAGSSPLDARLEPDASIHLREDGPWAREWWITGERGRFNICFQPHWPRLPAGWYRLSGHLSFPGAAGADGNTKVAASLAPTYSNGADGDAEILLPDPDGSGLVDTLVLLKFDVIALTFCPGPGQHRFTMGGFTLRPVSRQVALVRMLMEGRRAREVPSIIREAGAFVVDAAEHGRSLATRHLFQRYRRRIVQGDLGDYANWAARFDTISAEHLERFQRRVELLGNGAPIISVLVPAYGTPERWLRRAIESVINQAYPNWQLCLVDDASPDPQVLRIMDDYARGDSRIKVARRARNGHISAASNTALELASGEFVALLDHDDELRPHALLEIAEAIVRDPQLSLVYSDEDKIDLRGVRYDPYFKPSWDGDLLRSQNYICHLTAIRTALVREVGGFREGFEGSQDHDLFLRCTERLSPHQICHVPKVLYHWRAIPGSTALDRDAKDYAAAAGARAVSDHLTRCHPGASVAELSHGHYRVRWPVPVPAPSVSLVIPTRDRLDLLRQCVESVLRKTEYPDYEIVVVDNQSCEPKTIEYLQQLAAHPAVRVLRYDAPFNYSALNNWAVSQCESDIVGLLNNDVEVISPGWLTEMVAHACRPDVGAVGGMLYYPGGSIQHAGVVLGVDGVAAHLYCGMPRSYPGHGGRARVAQSLSAVTGACLVVRRELYETLGGLDEELEVAFNDVDFCLRLRRAGYHNIWTPFAELYHHESATRGLENNPEKKHRFASEVQFMTRRWGAALYTDPYYNPNLSLHGVACELAVPPRKSQPRSYTT